MNRRVIEIEKATKRFGKITALSDLNVVIDGKVNGLIGPNGAGKTTLLNVLLGLTRLDSGKVRVLGLDVSSELSEIKKKVGFLPESPGFPTSFTGEGFLIKVARLRHIQEPRKRVKEVLNVVDLSHAGKRAIRTYSSGMYQRLGLAQAIIGDPELIVLDEPAANLDPIGRMDVLRVIDEYSKNRGVSFLLSTHILYEVEKSCDWVGLMEGGRVRESGSIDELIQKSSKQVFRIVVSDPKLFELRLKQSGFAESVEFDGDAVVAEFPEGFDVYGEVVALAKRLSVRVIDLRRVRLSLDDVFRRVLKAD